MIFVPIFFLEIYPEHVGRNDFLHNLSQVALSSREKKHPEDQEIPNPYPWPPVPGCIAVSWVALPQDNAPDFQLHFVEDFVYDTVLHSIPSPGPPKKRWNVLLCFFLRT